MPRKQTLVARRDLPIFIKQEPKDFTSSSTQLLNLPSIYPRQSTQTTTTTKTHQDFSSYANTDIKSEIDDLSTTTFSGYQLMQDNEKPQVSEQPSFIDYIIYNL